MRRALLVSYYFPPRFSIGGKRAHRFAKYLPEHGWQTVVLTARAPGGERLDPSFSDAELPSCEVRRDYLSDADIAKVAGRAFGSDGTIDKPTEAWSPARERKGLARLVHELRNAQVIGPDSAAIPALATRIARTARSTNADVIFATGAPWETLVAATLGAKLARLPLVVELRDPWSFGPLSMRNPTWARTATRGIEALVLRAAAATVVTSEATREAYEKLGESARVECIRSGFDDAVRFTPQRSERVTFVHFGNCYGERTLAPFLRALAKLVRLRDLAPERIRILNLGRVARSDLELAASLGITKSFEHSTVLPYAEGIGIVAGADLSLLPNFGQEPWFIPGKVYDYLLAGAPILAISPPPELEGLLRTTRLGLVHDARDEDGIMRRMMDALEARTSGDKLVEPDAAAIAAMSARSAAARLASLLDDVERRRAQA